MPQRSVLGHTLFLIYVNDLLGRLNSHGKLFADDPKYTGKLQMMRIEKNCKKILKSILNGVRNGH